ncbi:dnaJ homolog subfamily C member 21-like isoform X2 [Hylaeus volcanicus]|uniref:dnaJ homolog subfamily C member 21-like isoform X2 n=1 Tax=Hylaeus volcanicus TaxID=313075 RepID=UPI0023B7790C|nr:dnaJ homolog subfamily C member 21-like isoform X2 [Hylaeus volcanicus]
MKCYYQVLGVEKNATSDQIKKAFKEMALKWHPDKNPNNTKEVQNMFISIQEAYETLSDPEERAWYDSHRSQILQEPLTTQGTSVDPLFQRVNLYNCFRKTYFDGYADKVDGKPNKNNFFSMYTNVFKIIVEIELKDSENPKTNDYNAFLNAPSFGDSFSKLSSMQTFYTFWSQFSSQRSFQYANKWDCPNACNRAMRRQWEAENKTLRLNAKKELNITVRALCSWLKKKDPRLVQAWIENAEKTRENRRSGLVQKRTENVSQEDNRLLQRKLELERWERLKVEKAEALKNRSQTFLDECEMSSESFQSDSQSDVTGTMKPKKNVIIYYVCEPCHRHFRSKAQYSCHEKSKKHKKTIQSLYEEINHHYDNTSVPCAEVNKDIIISEGEINNSKTNDLHTNKQDDVSLTFDVLSESVTSLNDDDSFTDQLLNLRLSRKKGISDSYSGSEEGNVFCAPESPKHTRVVDNALPRKHSKKKVVNRSSNASTLTEHVCGTCQAKFLSKNKLFCHLRSENHVQVLPTKFLNEKRVKSKKKKI